MAPLTKTFTSLVALALVSLVGSASAQENRHGIAIQPATNSDLFARPRGLFFSADDNTVDYNSYSYDDRFHGPPTSYSLRHTAPIYYFAPGHSAARAFGGDTLQYWRRSNPR
jgi:hypothetical protein